MLDTTLASAAAANGALPAGAKIAKLALRDITRFRSLVGPDFEVWDGSSRHLQVSRRNGPSGVVATPLAALPEPFPERSVQAVLSVRST